MARPARNPADVVLRARLRETIHFPDLTERLALRLSAIGNYTARAHFVVWHKKIGAPDFTDPGGVFTPLVYVEMEATDLPVDPRTPFRVQGETYLGKTLGADGQVSHLLREGHHVVMDGSGAVAARARYLNAFTRYSTNPTERRVTELPAYLNLGPGPSRVIERPVLDDLVPRGRAPDWREDTARVWHYGQTDANRHVNGMEYLRSMELFVADMLHAHGHDLKRLYFCRARIVYRKPCFRGEGYRRVGWVQGEAPLVIAGAFRKESDRPDARPAVAVELTLAQHDG